MWWWWWLGETIEIRRMRRENIKIVKIVEEGIKKLRKENNKIVEEEENKK